MSEALAKRVIDQGGEYARLQLVRLLPALRTAGEAVARGDIKAIAPLIKVLDRLDKHQTTFIKKHTYTEADRERLLARINRIAANLQDTEEAGGEDGTSRKAEGGEAEGGSSGEAEGEEEIFAPDSPASP